MKLNLIWIISLSIFIISCTKETQSYKLNLNENTYLLGGEPYTGLVIDKKKKTGRISRSFECVNGKIEGQYLQYYDNGRLYLKQRYLHGKLNGLSKQFNSNGSPRFYYTYKNGVMEGKQIIFDHHDAHADKDNWGDIETVYTLKNGKYDGYYHNKDGYYPHPKGYYKDGKMEGLWVYYGDVRGPEVVVAKGYFKNGNGTNLGATGIPRNGRVGKWYFYYSSGEKVIQEWHKNSDWYVIRGFDEFGSLVYHAKENVKTKESEEYLNIK